jgi:tripartite-type tricarboxylate transporter receptor subunit TctC
MLKQVTAILLVLFWRDHPSNAADFPTKEVQIIIPWAAGGATDLIFRALGPLQEVPHQAVVVVNRPGGGARWATPTA